MYVIKFKNGGNPYWLSEGNSDPSRTLLRKGAKRFKTVRSAKAYRTKIVNQFPMRYRELDIDNDTVIEPFEGSGVEMVK